MTDWTSDPQRPQPARPAVRSSFVEGSHWTDSYLTLPRLRNSNDSKYIFECCIMLTVRLRATHESKPTPTLSLFSFWSEVTAVSFPSFIGVGAAKWRGTGCFLPALALIACLYYETSQSSTHSVLKLWNQGYFRKIVRPIESLLNYIFSTGQFLPQAISTHRMNLSRSATLHTGKHSQSTVAEGPAHLKRKLVWQRVKTSECEANFEEHRIPYDGMWTRKGRVPAFNGGFIRLFIVVVSIFNIMGLMCSGWTLLWFMLCTKTV